MELLRDPLWQFIGALLAFAALPLAFWLYYLQKPRKELAYAVLSKRRLLSVASELRGRVQITLDDKPVEDIYLLIVGVKNSGTLPILDSDFVYTPKIRTVSSAQLVSVEVSKFRPVNLQVKLKLLEDNFAFSPLLLNPGDYFVVQALVSGKSPELEPDFRVVGMSKVETLRGSRPFSDRSDWGALAFWFFLFSFMIFAGTYMDTGPKKLLFIGVPGAIMLTVLYRWAKARYGAEASRYLVDG